MPLYLSKKIFLSATLTFAATAASLLLACCSHAPSTASPNAITNAITALPDWYTQGQPKPPGGRITFTTWRHWNAADPLLESGLIPSYCGSPFRWPPNNPHTIS